MPDLKLTPTEAVAVLERLKTDLVVRLEAEVSELKKDVVKAAEGRGALSEFIGEQDLIDFLDRQAAAATIDFRLDGKAANLGLMVHGGQWHTQLMTPLEPGSFRAFIFIKRKG
jgi:hypothetical protein